MARAGWRKHGSIFWVRPGFTTIPAHPSESRETIYNSIIIRLVIAMLRFQGIKLSISGSENIPRTGPALLAANHTGYYDFIFSGAVAKLHGHRLVRFMAKKEIFEVPVVGALMRKMKHIPVDRSAGASSLDAAIDSLADGNLVGIFPEATISRSFELKEFKTGAVRIASTANVPLIPMVLWGSQRVWTKDHPRKLGRNHIPVWVRAGAPIELSGDIEKDTQTLRDTMSVMLDELRAEYEEEYGPFPGGEYWRPKSLGGSAPTPAEADERDAEEKRQRAAKKAAKAKKKK
ncbi:1-acyl-sn-glycerol-3-phosphate acyltransferase [Corynebacterium mustelae]|uniref:1-acyl-sn-glycerol-3-phosphate acyltransferase n=1 Tax=Corynebacterium mustelae TaxID=571915 RepID=A0A0G3H1B1_9CORY|nr:lysophospholipid acyltransferase family protein [Corynebacterium mustelae]AKK07171.1 1-acyl-sn-glycerol-3-phosphate acyltransferase [Corynebacterium mustelae]